jgi:hypothetical protein
MLVIEYTNSEAYTCFIVYKNIFKGVVLIEDVPLC